jgi:hypothetical protein
MAGKKTSKTAAHGAPSPDDDPNEDGAPISEADVAKKRSKLILELVNERKKVEVLNKDIMKRVKEHATSVTKFLSVIALRDETILTKEVLLAQQKASVETYKVRLLSKDDTFKAQKKAFSSEHAAAIAVLQAQLESKKKEVLNEKSKALNVGRDLSKAIDKSNKLQADALKFRTDFDDLACQVRDSKSELTRVKKELSSTKKKILEQIDSTFAHKERMKDKELEKERIRYDKTKESNLSKLLSQERNHANTLARTEHRYEKAEKVNFDRHKRKTTDENQKTDTAVARAAQAAVNVQLAQNAGHFPNPRGVDLERVSYRCSRLMLLFVTHHFFFSRYLTTIGYGSDAHKKYNEAAHPHTDGICEASWEKATADASWLATEHL